MCLELRREPQTDPAAAAVGAVQHPVFLVKKVYHGDAGLQVSQVGDLWGPFRTERVCEEA